MARHRTAVAVVIGFELLLFASVSHSADYHSPRGFRLSYPDGWQIATQEDQRAVGEAAARFLQNIDLRRMDVVIYNPNSYPLQNVNVVVPPDLMPSGKDGVSEVESALRNQLSSAGVAVESVESRLAHLGSNDAIVSSWTASMGSDRVWQQQFIISGKVRSYIITCSVGAGSSADAAPVFASIVSSFQIEEEPSRTPGEWWDTLPGAVRFAIVGAGIGMGISVLGSLLKLARKN